MAVTKAIHSYGTGLFYGDASGTITTEVAEVIDVMLDETTGQTKATNLKSPNATHEYIPGLSEPGEITVTINYEKAQMLALCGLRRLEKWWKVVLPDNSTWIGQGQYTKLGNKVPDDDRITIDMTIKKAGFWTFTNGA